MGENYLMDNILIDGYCLSSHSCKYCIGFKQLDGLARKHQTSKFPLQNFMLHCTQEGAWSMHTCKYFA